MWGLLLWCFTVFAGAVAGDQAGFCLQAAQNLAPDDVQLTKGVKSMPPAHPVLAAYDWDLSKPANQQQATTAYKPCHAEAPIFRYKVYDRVVYADHEHHKDSRYQTYRTAFLEQLVLSMWLYKDFPNVDLVVDFTDHPQLCDQNIPFLRYSILNTSVLPASQQYNLTELLSPAWVTQQYAARVSTYTSGFTVPSPEAWRDLSLSPAQLADFSSCMDSTHPWTSKQLKAYWRGQATGCSRGWPQLAHAGSKHKPSTAAVGAGTPEGAHAAAPHLLRNKRVQMALRLFPYEPTFVDVGITSLPQLTPECLGPPGPAGLQRQAQQTHAGQAQSAGGRRRQRMRVRRRLPGKHLAQTGVPSARAAQDSTGMSGSLVQDVGRPLFTRQLAARHRWAAEQQPEQLGLLPDSAGAGDAAGGGEDQRSIAKVPPVRAYRGVARLLHKEGIGLEGWADAALTLSIDGYGPPFRLPQQLLLGSAVLRLTSPYQTWLDWDLVPGKHLQEFAYDLTDLEQQFTKHLGLSGSSSVGGRTGGGAGKDGASSSNEVASGERRDDAARAALQAMASAARALVASKVQVVAQLDAFAWSVARYKHACAWEVERPGSGDAWQVLTLGADLFTAKGVPGGLHLEVMQHLQTNFQAALHPALLQGGLGG